MVGVGALPRPQVARWPHPADAGRRDVSTISGRGACVDALPKEHSAQEPDGCGSGGVWTASRTHALCHDLAARTQPRV